MADTEDITWHDTPKVSGARPGDENITWHGDEPTDHGLSERQKLSPVGKALSPVTGYWDTYQRMLTEARHQMSRGAGQIADADSLIDPKAHGIADVATGFGNIGLGALGFIASPLTAGLRSIVSQPIEDVTGIPRDYTEFAAQILAPELMRKLPTAPLPPNYSPTRAPPPPPGSGPAVVEAADRLSQTGAPVEISRAATSDRVPVQQLGQVVSNVPYAGAPLVNASGRTLEQLGAKAEEVAGSYGSAGKPADAGEVASKSLTDWITGESQAKADKAYAKVDAAVNPAILTPLDHTLDVISQIAAKQQASHLPPGRAVDIVLPAATAPGGLTYEGIKNLRTNIGGMLKSGILPEGVDGGQLKQIYGALSDDLGVSVAASGPQAQAAFDRANKYYDLLKDRRSALAKIVGAQGDAAPERVFDRLTAMASSGPRADITKLTQARKAMGADDWNEISSAVVGRLGRDVEGNFSAQRFVSDYNNLSEAGRNLLFKSTDNPLKTHLDDIATVSSRFKRLQQFANPSGTARGVLGAAGLGGLFVEPLTTLTTMLGTNLTARVLAKPAQAASVAKWSRAKYAVAASPGPATIAAYGLASRNLLSTIGSSNVTPDDFIRQLQQPSQ
jgi:hypothetical protein